MHPLPMRDLERNSIALQIRLDALGPFASTVHHGAALRGS